MARLQRKKSQTNPSPSTGSFFPAKNIYPKPGGSSLSVPINSSTGQAFGSDFSQVRVSAGSLANEMNKGIQAKAVTQGSDTYVHNGPNNPDSSRGKKLLAHKLPHVVQQRSDKELLQRMLSCPSSLNESDPVPEGFKPYQGNSKWFHCGFRGILEDKSPTPEDPQNECFYDESGKLVDENHPYSGCAGTPNDFDSSASTWDHIFNDRGGIWQKGWGAFKESRRYFKEKNKGRCESKHLGMGSYLGSDCIIRQGPGPKY